MGLCTPVQPIIFTAYHGGYLSKIKEVFNDVSTRKYGDYRGSELYWDFMSTGSQLTASGYAVRSTRLVDFSEVIGKDIRIRTGRNEIADSSRLLTGSAGVYVRTPIDKVHPTIVGAAEFIIRRVIWASGNLRFYVHQNDLTRGVAVTEDFSAGVGVYLNSDTDCFGYTGPFGGDKIVEGMGAFKQKYQLQD